MRLSQFIAAPLFRAAALFLCALATGCSEGPGDESAGPSPQTPPLAEREVPGRVFLVGIDGASWDVFDHVLADGVMPRLQELCARGTKAELLSMNPTASAILWTTIATGKLPKQHGILGFVATTDTGNVVPVSSTMRKVDALWNICSRAGAARVALTKKWESPPKRRLRAGRI